MYSTKSLPNTPIHKEFNTGEITCNNNKKKLETTPPWVCSLYNNKRENITQFSMLKVNFYIILSHMLRKPVGWA